MNGVLNLLKRRVLKTAVDGVATVVFLTLCLAFFT